MLRRIDGRWLLGLALLVFSAACEAATDRQEAVGSVPGGDPSRAGDVVAAYGCGACHMIPGLEGADGTVGPPLTGLAERQFIAGRLANTPENLIVWIQHPQAIDPGVAMPEMGVTEQDARDIAAYLLTLR